MRLGAAPYDERGLAVLGVLVLLGLFIAVITVNRWCDQGIRERRALRGTYGALLTVMAEFVEGGGRIQEIDGSTAIARRGMRSAIVAPLLLIGGGVGLTTWLDLTTWIAPAVLAGWVLLSGLFHWLVTDLFELTDGEGRSTGPERLLVVAGICAKAALVLAGVLLAQHGVAAIQAGHWLPGLASHATAVALLTYCYVPAAWVERLARMRREVSFAHAASTDAVLFLRSFTDDDFRLYTPLAALGPRYRFIPGRKRFEEFLSAVLYSTAELVAVGRPGERLPTLGGSRTYWATDAWQEAIRSTASRTHALIVMAGRTPSLAWELGQLREMSLLGKTLVVFPPDGAEGTAERYRFVTDALRTAPVHRLPPELLHALTAVAFDATGTPVHYLSCGRDWSSYTTSLLHYFGTLRGTATFEDRSALTAVTEWVEDPFAQAAYLLDRREHALARAIVAEAISARSDADALLGAAWFAAEVKHDHPEARRLLEEARRRAPDAPEVTQAVALVDGLERGAGDPRALLRLRWPEVLQSRPDPVRQGNVKLRGLARMQLVRGIQQWAIAHEAEQYDNAAEHAGELRDLGEQAGNPTVVAFAMCCLGDSLAAAGDLDDAETAYSTAAGLRAAPRVPLAPLPALDPVEIVEEALEGRCRIARKRKDRAAEVRILCALRDFQITEGRPEGAGRTALDLAEQHLQARNWEEATAWADIAFAELSTTGRSLAVAEARLRQAEAADESGQHERAVELAADAAERATTSGGLHLAAASHHRAGRAATHILDAARAWIHFEAAHRLAQQEGSDVRIRTALNSLIATDAARSGDLVTAHAEQLTDAELAGGEAMRLAHALTARDEFAGPARVLKGAVARLAEQLPLELPLLVDDDELTARVRLVDDHARQLAECCRQLEDRDGLIHALERRLPCLRAQRQGPFCAVPLLRVLYELGEKLAEAERFGDSLGAYAEAVTIQRELLADDPGELRNFVALNASLALAHHRVGDLETECGVWEENLALLRRQDHADEWVRARLRFALSMLARASAVGGTPPSPRRGRV